MKLERSEDFELRKKDMEETKDKELPFSLFLFFFVHDLCNFMLLINL